MSKVNNKQIAAKEVLPIKKAMSDSGESESTLDHADSRDVSQTFGPARLPDDEEVVLLKSAKPKVRAINKPKKAAEVDRYWIGKTYKEVFGLAFWPNKGTSKAHKFPKKDDVAEIDSKALYTAFQTFVVYYVTFVKDVMTDEDGELVLKADYSRNGIVSYLWEVFQAADADRESKLWKNVWMKPVSKWANLFQNGYTAEGFNLAPFVAEETKEE